VTDYSVLLYADFSKGLHHHHNSRHLTSHNALDYCADATEFDILNLHSYDAYDWFLFIFTVVLLNALCFGCGCVGYRLTFTSGSQAAALIRQITSPHLVEMETPHQTEVLCAHCRDGMALAMSHSDGGAMGNAMSHSNCNPLDGNTKRMMQIDVNLDFQEVATPTNATQTVMCQLPPLDERLRGFTDNHFSMTRYSGSMDGLPTLRAQRRFTSRSATSAHNTQRFERYSGSMSNLKVMTRGQTTRRSATAHSFVESTLNERTPDSSDSSRTHLTWIRPEDGHSRSVSDSELEHLDRAQTISVGTPDGMPPATRLTTLRRSRSNLSKLEPIDEAESGSDSVAML